MQRRMMKRLYLDRDLYPVVDELIKLLTELGVMYVGTKTSDEVKADLDAGYMAAHTYQPDQMKDLIIERLALTKEAYNREHTA